MYIFWGTAASQLIQLLNADFALGTQIGILVDPADDDPSNVNSLMHLHLAVVDRSTNRSIDPTTLISERVERDGSGECRP